MCINGKEELRLSSLVVWVRHSTIYVGPCCIGTHCREQVFYWTVSCNCGALKRLSLQALRRQEDSTWV